MVLQRYIRLVGRAIAPGSKRSAGCRPQVGSHLGPDTAYGGITTGCWVGTRGMSVRLQVYAAKLCQL